MPHPTGSVQDPRLHQMIYLFNDETVWNKNRQQRVRSLDFARKNPYQWPTYHDQKEYHSKSADGDEIQVVPFVRVDKHSINFPSISPTCTKTAAGRK